VAILWSTASLPLFTFTAQRPHFISAFAGGVSVSILICDVLIASSWAVRLPMREA
jgi:hypothetical protein